MQHGHGDSVTELLETGFLHVMTEISNDSWDLVGRREGPGGVTLVLLPTVLRRNGCALAATCALECTLAIAGVKVGGRWVPRIVTSSLLLLVAKKIQPDTCLRHFCRAR